MRREDTGAPRDRRRSRPHPAPYRADNSRPPLMASAQPTFHLEWFEFIPTTPMHALLRVRGNWEGEATDSHPAPHLLADRAGRTHRFAPLDPAEALIVPHPEPHPWRAAFAVPLDVVEDHSAEYVLEAAGG